MSFFKPFAIIKGYPFQGKLYNFMDITQEDKLPKTFKENNAFYFKYTVGAGETPEILADRIYEDVGLYWVLMTFNDRLDVYSDWALSEVSLNRHIETTYGAGNANVIHHYESIATGAVVDSTHVTYDRLPVTNYEFESKKNDDKREIKVLLPQFVGAYIQYHKTG